MRYAVKIAYDGYRYHGFARQPHLNTIEEAIIKAMQQMQLISSFQDANFSKASRTDKKVSCLANVIAFNSLAEIKGSFKEINALLSDIYFYGFAEVDKDFYPRHALRRGYRYYLKNPEVDLDIIMQGASLFTGIHNFTNFARIEKGRNPVRTIDAILIKQDPKFIVLDIFAQTFLWHQVRRIIAALYKLGTNKIELDDIQKALNKPDKHVDFGIAPAEPLILISVDYPFSFRYIEGYFERLHDLERLIIQRLI